MPPQHDPFVYRRKSIRLSGYDYSSPGAYFATICTKDRELLLGNMRGGIMFPSGFGRVVEDCWNDVSSHFPNAKTDEVVVMPNHVHGIIFITESASQEYAPLAARAGNSRPYESSRPTLGQIAAYFKYQSTKKINQVRDMQGTPFWQRNYYERVIRNESELYRTRQYILSSPEMWDQDEHHPENLSDSVMNAHVTRRGGETPPLRHTPSPFVTGRPPRPDKSCSPGNRNIS